MAFPSNPPLLLTPVLYKGIVAEKDTMFPMARMAKARINSLALEMERAVFIFFWASFECY